MRARYVRTPTEVELQELKQLQRAGKSHSERRRAQCVLVSAAGNTLKETATVLGMARSTVGRTLRAFEERGVAGLQEPRRPGRPSRVSPAVRDALDQALQASPREAGFPTNNWTAPLVAQLLATKYGVQLSADQALNWMRRLNFRRVRPRPRLAKGDADAKLRPAAQWASCSGE